jgi:UDP:flavonoid glycosyltransferase YjiC (YdhE family)
VLHHAGAGSSLTTATSGVPAVCLPQMGDQFRNAGLLAAAGAALVLDPDQADRDSVAELTSRALTDPSIAGAAAGVGKLNAALPGPNAMVDRLELLN